MKRFAFFLSILLSGFLAQAQSYPLSNFLVTLPESRFGTIVPNPSNLVLLHGPFGYSLWRLKPNDKATPAGPNILVHPGTNLRYERLLTTGAINGSGNSSSTTINTSNIIGLGTAAVRNVPASGNAATNQVVLGSDDRLINARTPVDHTHTLTDISDAQTALNLKVPTSRTIDGGSTISGGGNLGSNLNLAVVPNTTIQKIEFLNSGSLIGTRKRLNVTTSGDAAITLTDDPGNDRVNLNISATAGSGTMPAPSGTGIVVQDGVSSSVTRSITSSSGITITNGSGVVGNINIAPSSELAGVQALSSTGPVTRTGSGTYTAAALDLGSGSLTGTLAAARMPAITGDISIGIGTVSSTYNNVVPSNKGGAGTINGLIKANGLGVTSLAVAGTDYLTPTGSAALLTSFPTLNQNTTGSAATLTTSRNIYGNPFNGSTSLTQIIGSAFGGTNNGFTAFSGPTTSEKTFTLPNASAIILTDNTPVTIAQGGTNSTTASGARTALGGTTVGSGFFTLANPSAITFPRINADNTVSALDAAAFRTAIGAGTSSATVNSVALSLPSFITVSGSPVTSTGTLTGTLASQTANHVFIAPNGSSGSPTFRALVSADLPAAIDAVKLADGTVTNAELQHIGTLSSNAQNQIDTKSPIASPTFTGTPLVPTATAGTNTTQIASTAFVKTAVDTRVLIVADVATLKTITGVSGQIATTSGYYAANDGGGNTYTWNASSTATQDNGSIIQVTSVSTGRWISVEQTEVLVKRWGAKGDGSVDDTTPLTAALAYAISNSKLLVFTEGDYKISNFLMNATDFNGSENLFIRIVGNVKITASSSMLEVDKCIINYGKQNTGNVSITGDALTVNLRRKFRGFFDIKNYGIVGGTYYTTIDGDFHCKLGSLVVKNAYAAMGGDAIAYGISVIGSYKRVTIENVIVDSVTRYNAAWGECKGINVSGTKGDVFINNCKVSNVRSNAAYMANADGINVFGEKQNPAIENSFRLGTTTITNCVLSDNQGRSIKIQVSDATIQNCKFLRQYVTTIDNGHDIDVQFGNGKILNNTCIYKKNGATSPLGTYFAAFKFQNVLPNAEHYSLARDNVIYTEAVLPYAFFITHGNVLSPDTVKASVVDIINNHVINTGTFVGTGSIQRGFCEFNADELNKVVDRCEINLRDNSFFASSTSALLSYNAAIYDVEDQLTFRLVGNKNTNTAQTPFLFHNYFGGQIDSVDTYQVWANQGFSESFHTTWKVNLGRGKIIAPSRIAFDLYYHTLLTNKPPTVGTSGNAIISVLGDWASGNAKIELYENTGGSNDYLHYSTSASAWKKTTFVQTLGGDGRVLSVDNVATLKTITGVAGQIATTKGYYADGDGGGNTYYWNTSSTAAKDSGLVFQAHGVTTGRWLSVEQREVFSKRWGAKGDGLNDDTAYLKSALTYAINNSKNFTLTEGDYKVTANLYNNEANTGTKNLYIRLVGNVKITVPSTQDPEINTALIVYGHQITSNVSITGGSLLVQLNNKCRGFLEIRNNGIVGGTYYTTTGGELDISANSVIVKKAYAGSASDKVAYGIFAIGSFSKTNIQNVTVDSVSRHNSSGGECNGIAIASTRGLISVSNCRISNVIAPASYLVDADGLKVSGMQEDVGVTNSFRQGIALINNCIFTDNQGRNTKFQISSATLTNCTFERKMVVGIGAGHDIDFQFGSGKVLGCTFNYKKNGATSPLGSSFIPVMFQNVLTNREMHAIARDNVFYTEIAIRSPFYVITASGASSSVTDLLNNKVVGILTLSGAATLERGFCEFNSAEVQAVTGTVTINMTGNSSFSGGVPLLAYNSVSTADLTTKLIFRLANNTNENTSVEPRAFAPISGSNITSVNKYQLFANSGYRSDLTSNWVVNLNANRILPPSEFVIDLGTNTVTNGPTMGSSGYATIKVMAQWNGGQPITEIYERTGGANDYMHVSMISGTWKKATFN